MTDKVQCDVHGPQQATFVCQHIVQGLNRRERVGFHWPTGASEETRPDAWCAACEERAAKHNGEWVGEAEENLKIKILCGACYDLVKKFHMGENPWS